MMTAANEPAFTKLLRIQEERLDAYLAELKAGNVPKRAPGVPGFGVVELMLPLLCHPSSKYYRNPELIAPMEGEVNHTLSAQHPSGCVSLVNCNIDSPPDTGFHVPVAALLYKVGRRYPVPEAEGVLQGLLTFMERAKPCLLTGGIHTPNHRWVMSGALANLYELFGDEAFKERAFQFLDEQFDITEYGEWTERSNGIYNGACDLHLYDVGVAFGYEPAFEAIRANLTMMTRMIHPDGTVATEYSGRQDAGKPMGMNDWYVVVCRLMAAHDRNPLFAALAREAERTAPMGSSVLLHAMLRPEIMALPDAAPLEDRYTVLFGEGNEVPVPRTVPYLGKRVRHPHGAPVLRHRRGLLSVTVMAGQREFLYVQYGKARLMGAKLEAGWFGVAGIAFPSIRRIGPDAYRLELELEGCYFAPLPKEVAAPYGGRYVDMPNDKREKTHVSCLPVAIEVRLDDAGLDVRVLSDGVPNIYLQLMMMFDPAGTMTGAGLQETAPYVRCLTEGELTYERDGDCIRVSPGAKEHDDAVMRNDIINRDALNATIHWRTPTDRMVRIDCFRSGSASQEG